MEETAQRASEPTTDRTELTDILDRLVRLERALRPSVDYLTVEQAAAVTSVCTATLRRAIKAGALRAFNVSKGGARATWRVTRSDLDAYMQADQAVPSGAPDPGYRSKALGF